MPRATRVLWFGALDFCAVMQFIDRVWKHQKDDLVLILAGILMLVPVLFFPFFPTQDGPSHLATTAILLHYNDAGQPLLREYFSIQTTLLPNWLVFFVLGLLMTLLPALVAEKFFLAGLVFMYLFSARYMVRAVNPQAGFLALLALPFFYNLTLHKGFYNFNLSVPFYFLFLGFWIRNYQRLDIKKIIVLNAIAFLMYLTHLVSLGMAFVAITVLTIIAVIDRVRLSGADDRARTVVARLLQLVLICLPMTILTAAFVWRKGIGSVAPALNRLRSVWDVIRLDSLVTFPAFDPWIAFGVAGVFGFLVIYFLIRRKGLGFKFWDSLLIVCIVYCALYVLAPTNIAGGSFIGVRLSLYPAFLLILWFGAQEWSVQLKRVVQVLICVLLLAMISARVLVFQKISPLLTDYVSIGQDLSPNRTFWGIVLNNSSLVKQLQNELGRDFAFAHAADYLATERGILNLANYEAKTDYFPIILRKKHEKDALPSTGQLKSLKLKLKPTVDYIYLWGERTPLDGQQLSDSFIETLKQNYVQIYTTPTGYGTLYRRKGINP